MSIYKCPHCGKKSFNPWTKAMTGQLNSKGRPCMECGRLCVNGKGATIFKALYCLAAFAVIIYIYIHGADNEWMFTHEAPMVIGLILSMFIVPRVVNAFFFSLAPSIRIDTKE
ncbi:hypothetical protein [uncultured Ruminococcus sp.]|uniref:hypothetical protein n=1 Tax=uncultured Ruminococcus sp. TaxID=165186 RepID=UPI00260321F4|nr:hypothetical protein [uncultured Ruminococcus sp.]